MVDSLLFSTKLSVLYSRQGVWKLADFGLTTEGSGTQVNTTVFARGTPSYRAPELFSEPKARFNNRVDIWSLGCILYELAVGQKAFKDDFAVLFYRQDKNRLEISLEGYEEKTSKDIAEEIQGLLDLDQTQRPSAVNFISRVRGYLRDSAKNLPGGFSGIHLDLQRLGLAEDGSRRHLSFSDEGLPGGLSSTVHRLCFADLYFRKLAPSLDRGFRSYSLIRMNVQCLKDQSQDTSGGP